MTHSILGGLVAVVVWGSAAYAEPADLTQVKERGRLRVLAVEGSPQFFSLKDNDAPGFDREILEGFARLHRLDLEPVEVASWSGLIPALLDKKGDLAAGGVTATEGRQKLVDFSAEVFPTRLVVMTRKPQPRVDTLEQLRGLRVGSIRGSSMQEALTAAKVPPANIDDSIASGGLPAALRAGKIAACVQGVEDAILEQRKDREIELGLYLGPSQSLAFAARKDQPELLAALSDYLDKLRKTGAWSRLVVKYFGERALEVLHKAQDSNS